MPGFMHKLPELPELPHFEIHSSMHHLGDHFKSFFDRIHDIVKNGGHIHQVKVVRKKSRDPLFHKHEMPDDLLDDIEDENEDLGLD